MLEPSSPPSYNDVLSINETTKNQKIYDLIQKYEIDPLFSEKLDILSDYEIVLLLDDSGSMSTPISDSQHSTRWDELKYVVKIVISIATIFDEDGIDIHFLNRESYYNVKSLKEVDNSLEGFPYGTTPLTYKFNSILNQFEDSEKPVLIVIATDGVPNNLNSFTHALKNKNHSKFYVSFLACSDQEFDIGYLNDLDKSVPNVDVLDDYNSELKEVQYAQGKGFRYTFGDHIVRLLLGPLCPELDELDECSYNQDIYENTRFNCVIL